MTCTRNPNQLTTHSLEPWHYEMDRSVSTIVAADPTGEYPGGVYVAEIDGQDVGQFATNEQHEANARRIVAAVNACQGISTEALEQGVLAELLQQLMLLADHLETPPHDLTEAMRALRLRQARVTIAKANGRAA
jgi:hypothetical protein